MLSTPARRHDDHAGFVVRRSVAEDLKSLAIEGVIGVLYRDGTLQIVGIMRQYSAGAPSNGRSYRGCSKPAERNRFVG